MAFTQNKAGTALPTDRKERVVTRAEVYYKFSQANEKTWRSFLWTRVTAFCSIIPVKGHQMKGRLNVPLHLRIHASSFSLATREVPRTQVVISTLSPLKSTAKMRNATKEDRT